MAKMYILITLAGEDRNVGLSETERSIKAQVDAAALPHFERVEMTPHNPSYAMIVKFNDHDPDGGFYDLPYICNLLEQIGGVQRIGYNDVLEVNLDDWE